MSILNKRCTIRKIRNQKTDVTGARMEVIVVHISKPYTLLFPYAVLKCLCVRVTRSVDVINSVSNPFHLQLIGYIVSQVLNLPWLVEFCDPMVESPNRDPDAFPIKIAAHSSLANSLSPAVWR